MTTPTNAAVIASTRKGNGCTTARTDQSHDAYLGTSGVRGDLNHVGYQENCADRLHEGHRERGVPDAVEDGEEPVDQHLLVQDPAAPRVAGHRLVELLMLFGSRA